MRFLPYAICCALVLCCATGVSAKDKKPAAPASSAAPAQEGIPPGRIEVTADKSLEWYEDTHLYVARDHAKAVRGTMTVEADLLTAHERDKTPKEGATKKDDAAKTETPPANGAAKPAADNSATGDIDKMTAEGHVHVTMNNNTNIYGDHGVYDTAQHVAFVTGNNLKYETPDQVVTAKDSLEYWEDKKLAVARGHAVGVRGDRHVEGDVLTAQFRDMPNGKTEMHTMTADGNVTVITSTDVSRADRAVYDLNRNIAVLTGHVRITRPDGTQLTGDVGEVDFATNQSRLINEGTGRVRALLTSKASPKSNKQASAVSP